MIHFNDTSHEEHMRELEVYTKYLCRDCDFKYMVFDEHGVIEYCPVTEIYEPDMRRVKKCDHYRVNNQYR